MSYSSSLPGSRGRFAALLRHQPVAPLDLRQERVGAVLLPFVDDEVRAEPAVGDAGLGQRRRHVRVHVERPIAEVVDELVLFGEVERIDIVAGVVDLAGTIARRLTDRGLAGVVVLAAAGVAGHRGTLPGKAVNHLPQAGTPD